MTETVKASQEDTKKDSSQQPSSPKTKSKAVKQTTEGNDRPKSNEKVEKPPTKVVVRRLPPTMTLETFLDQVAPLPPVDYMYFVKADSSLTPNSFARAYLHFVHVGDLLIFTEKFDNYVFVDSKGNEYPAIVEYAPFQRIPKQRSSRKKDPRIGTIGNDPYYLEFLEALKAEETQRKSASKTNKQHFFETSTTGSVTPKVTSTPLLEFLKARRADKLKTKEDKIAERRKREIERRKAREDARISVKHVKVSEGDSDISAPSQIKIAGHGLAADKASKDSTDLKRSSKEPNVKEIMSKRRDDDRGKARDRDRERRDKDTKEPQKEQKRDIRKDSSKDQGPIPDKEKDKENQPNTFDAKSKEPRRGGKSYQEERQRLNERRLAAKGIASKSSGVGDGSNRSEKGESASNEDINSEKKSSAKKEMESSSELRNRPHDKYKGSDKYQQQNTKEPKKFEKPTKSGKDLEPKRSYDSKRSVEDRFQDDSKEVKRNVSNDKTDSNPPKEETRKKSYNQEREQRRAANKREQGGSKSEVSDSKVSCTAEENQPEKEGHSSIDNSSNKKGGNTQDETSKRKSVADIKSSQTSSGGASSSEKKKSTSDSRGEEKDKKDPRAERRIRNKDRPSIEIYRPGMGRFSRQRLEREKVLGKGSSTERESPSSSPSPVPSSAKTSVISENDNE